MIFHVFLFSRDLCLYSLHQSYLLVLTLWPHMVASAVPTFHSIKPAIRVSLIVTCHSVIGSWYRPMSNQFIMIFVLSNLSANVYLYLQPVSSASVTASSHFRSSCIRTHKKPTTWIVIYGAHNRVLAFMRI